MKVQVVPPMPPIDDIQITISRPQAVALRKFIGSSSDHDRKQRYALTQKQSTDMCNLYDILKDFV